MNFEEMKSLSPDKQRELFDNLSKIRAVGKATNYSCLPTDSTEVLTISGWKTFEEVCVGDLVMTYDQPNNTLVWGVIKHKHFYENAPCVLMENKHIRLESTNNHRWFGRQRVMLGGRKTSYTRYYKDCVKTTEEINSEFVIVNAAPYVGGSRNISANDAALVAWLLSDGYYKWSGRSETTSSSGGSRKGINASIAQAEHKYWRDLENVLNTSGVTYHKYATHDNKFAVYHYKLDSKPIREFLDRVVCSRKNKHEVDWVSWVLSLNKECLSSFLHHFNLADGTKKKVGDTITISQNAGNILDAVCICSTLLGRRTNVTGSQKCKIITSINKQHTTAARIKKSYSRNTDVFCLTTDHGNFIIRQNGLITITGNCQYGAGFATIARTAKVSEKVGKKLHAGYWKLNWSIKKIAESTTVKKTSFGMFQKNPVNGFWYSLRSDKDRVSTLIQGLGSYILDVWLLNIFNIAEQRGLEVMLLGQFHKQHCGFAQ